MSLPVHIKVKASSQPVCAERVFVMQQQQTCRTEAAELKLQLPRMKGGAKEARTLPPSLPPHTALPLIQTLAESLHQTCNIICGSVPQLLYTFIGLFYDPDAQIYRHLRMTLNSGLSQDGASFPPYYELQCLYLLLQN